jgi:[glutamine synthetase] adenylyltransferase / [glutamine synthetase]-adenylyl-L-tyrosine phosphorylase
MSTLASRIIRAPHPFEPGRGLDVASHFPGSDASMAALIKGVAGSSPYLASVVAAHADWLTQAFDAPEDALNTLNRDLTAPTLRQGKARMAGLVALLDLGGVFTLEQVTGGLSDFADRATQVALDTALSEAIDRRQLPEGAAMSIFAMGKWGARELNYSSDIDLICLFDHHAFPPDDVAQVRAGLVKVTRRLTALLSDVTDQGYVFRTDLRLRPDAAVTPVCLPMETALRYYESVGRTWERAAWIKARVAAGDAQAGAAFLKDLQPFIWRKHLDFAAISDTHDMLRRIREHRALNGRLELEGHNLKLGKGGIREIEFFAQTRQLIAGGRDEGLRQSDTVGALAVLAAKGWVEPETARILTEDYRAHREVEHRLQMIHDAQTHDLPSSPEGFARLAAFMGTSEADLRATLRTRIERVAALTEPFFDPGTQGAAPERTERMSEIMSRWRTYPAFRTDRAMDLFRRFEPALVEGLKRAADPEAALLRLDTFLQALPGGVQLFSLFSANPNLIDLIVTICAASPALALHLGRNAQVLDSVIDGDFFAPLPDLETLSAELAKPLEQLDYEAALITLRRSRADWHFRNGVHHLLGLQSAEEAGHAYARLARATLNALLPIVIRDLERRHGTMPGQGLAVLGMGSLGAGWLTANSDLDLILIYDTDGNLESDGPRPLPARMWFARLTQALVTALSAPMAGGKLYDVDMRLRPSGRQGPVATSLAGFKSYQQSEAWVWEHLALTRATVAFGSGGLAEALREAVDHVIARPRTKAEVMGAVADMRSRLADAKGEVAPWDVKAGPGGLMDIELLASGCELLNPKGATSPPLQLDDPELVRDWQVLQAFRTTMALVADRPADPAEVGGTAPALLARDTGLPESGLNAALAEVKARAAARIGAVIAKETT